MIRLNFIKSLLGGVAFIILLSYTSGCTSDNEKEFYGGLDCDTLNVKYSEVIDPILDRNCVSCHFTGSNGTGVSLQNYADVKVVVDNGRLLGAINHEPGYSPMPQGGELDDCTISKIEAWVNKGAPND